MLITEPPPLVISRTKRTDVLIAMKNLFLLLGLLIPALSQAQTYTVDWSSEAAYPSIAKLT